MLVVAAASTACRSSVYTVTTTRTLDPAIRVTMSAPDSIGRQDTAIFAFRFENRSARPIGVSLYAREEWSVDPIIYRENGSVLWERAVSKMTIMSGATAFVLSRGSNRVISMKWVPADAPAGRYSVVGRVVGIDGSFIWTGPRVGMTIR